MDIYERMFKSGNCSTIHFIETSSSLLYNAPYINTTVRNKCYSNCNIITFYVQTLQPKEDADKIIRSDYFCSVELVYGLQGKEQLY